MSEEDVRKEIQRLNDLYIKESDKKIVYSREVVDSLIFAKTNKLEQENKALRDTYKTKLDEFKNANEEIDRLRKEKNRLEKLLNSPAYRDVYVIKYQRDLYKEVVKEVRGIIESGLDFDNPQYADECKKELLQILDKAKGSDK